MSKLSSTDLSAFQAIVEFITAMYDCFGTKMKPLQLFNRLIQNTKFTDTKIIQQHIDCVRNFCIKNRECILNKNTQFVQNQISFSERIYVDMRLIFMYASKTGEEDPIWEHLMALSAVLDSGSDAKWALQKFREEQSQHPKETNIIHGMMEEVDKQMTPEMMNILMSKKDNPLDMVGTIMQSDMFKNIVGGLTNQLQNDELNMNDLMKTVSGLLPAMMPPPKK